MFKFSVLSTEKAAGENVLPLRELPCLCLMICVNIIKKAAKEVLAAIFMIFYLTERKFVVLFLDRVTGYEPVGRGFESLQARQAKKASQNVMSFLLSQEGQVVYPSSISKELKKHCKLQCFFFFILLLKL